MRLPFINNPAHKWTSLIRTLPTHNNHTHNAKPHHHNRQERYSASYPSLGLPTNTPPPPLPDRLPPASHLLSLAFAHDPVITYMLHSMPAAERATYLPNYFSTLLKAAALNGATFDEAHEWASCGVLVPAGKRVDNLWTLLPAGFAGMAWRVGRGGCMVRLLLLDSSLRLWVLGLLPPAGEGSEAETVWHCPGWD